MDCDLSEEQILERKKEIMSNLINLIYQGQRVGAFENIQIGALMIRSCKIFTEKNFSHPTIKTRGEAINNILKGIDICQAKGLIPVESVIQIDESITELKVLIIRENANQSAKTAQMSNSKPTTKSITEKGIDVEDLID
jgi:hypothetical protein